MTWPSYSLDSPHSAIDRISSITPATAALAGPARRPARRGSGGATHTVGATRRNRSARCRLIPNGSHRLLLAKRSVWARASTCVATQLPSRLLMLNWSECSAVERVSGKVGGAWVFKDSRVPVRALFENLESGATVEDFLAWFQGVKREQVEAVLDHAQRSLAGA
jgi:uncharacterized protein (DUF433 family)